MKISSRKFGILIIFVIFALIETISFATYTSVVEEEQERINNRIEIETSIKNDAVELSEDVKETLRLINEYRVKNGLGELKIYSKLQDIAQLKAEDLVENNYFSHTSPNLGTPFEMLKDNGIKYEIAGENLAGNISPEKAVEAWINSPTHRDNILEGKFQYTGIYIIDSPVYEKVFVQLFM